MNSSIEDETEDESSQGKDEEKDDPIGCKTKFESEGTEVDQTDCKSIPQKDFPVRKIREDEPREEDHSFFTHLQGHEMDEELRTRYEDENDSAGYGESLAKKAKPNSRRMKGVLDVSTHKSKMPKRKKTNKLNKKEHKGDIATSRSTTKVVDNDNDGDIAVHWDKIDGFDDKDMEKPHFIEPASHPFEPLVLSEPELQPIIQVPATINCRLREYQREGIKFLYKHFHDNHGAILGDDMGLGKTIQVISLLAAVLGKTGTKADVFGKYMEDNNTNAKKSAIISKVQGCFLIISPGSVLYNWGDELETWGHFKVKYYHGNSKAGVLEQAANSKLDVVLSTYETFKMNLEKFNKVKWLAVIMDEAHKLKDPTTQITMAAKALNVKRRYGLTGTPLQNRFAEFWSVLDWANPGCLGSSKTFMKQYSRPIKKGQRFNVTKRELAVGRTMSKQLQLKLSKWFLRRTKDLISDQLPHKDDKVVFCTMTSFQEDVYLTLLQSSDVKLITRKDFPCDCSSGKARGKCCYTTDEEGEPLRSVLMRFLQLLLKAANHTALLMPQVKQTNDQRMKAKAICDQVFARHPQYAESLATSSFQTLSDPSYCGKMKILDRLLRMFEKERSKVLLFSQSFQLLNILEEYVIGRGMIYSRLDGKTKTSQRAVIVREFNNNPEIFVCLISTRAGALGLNFTGANVVIIFDPTWNPANDLQAQDRAYRIGQRQDVQVFRLISCGTIEEMMYLRQIYKQQMSNIAVKGTSERRYFTGVEGEKDLKGELFGIENLFSYRADGVSLAQDIITRTDRLEAGLRVDKYRIMEESKEDEESHCSDEDVPVSTTTDLEKDEYDVEMVVSQLFDDDPFDQTAATNKSGLERQTENETADKECCSKEEMTDLATTKLCNKDDPALQGAAQCDETQSSRRNSIPTSTAKKNKIKKKRKDLCFPKISREKRLKKYLKEFFSSPETSESSQEVQNVEIRTKALKKTEFENSKEDQNSGLSEVKDTAMGERLSLDRKRQYVKTQLYEEKKTKEENRKSGKQKNCSNEKPTLLLRNQRGIKDANSDSEISMHTERDEMRDDRKLTYEKRFTKVKDKDLQNNNPKKSRQELTHVDCLTNCCGGDDNFPCGICASEADDKVSDMVQDGGSGNGLVDVKVSGASLSCNIPSTLSGGYFSLSEENDIMDQSQDIDIKMQRRLASRRRHKGQVAVKSNPRKVKAVVKDGSSNGITKVEKLLSNCGVNYTHANRSVVRSSKAENHMSKRAIQDVFELRQFSQQPANCFVAFEVSDESDDVAEKSTKARDRDKTSAEQSSARSTNRHSPKLINTLSKVLDIPTARREIETKIEKARVLSRGKNSRKQMTTRHFKRKGIVFDDADDDDDDDDDATVIKAKRKMPSTSGLDYSSSHLTNIGDNIDNTDDYGDATVDRNPTTRTCIDDGISISHDPTDGTSLDNKHVDSDQGKHISSILDEFLELKPNMKKSRITDDHYGSLDTSNDDVNQSTSRESKPLLSSNEILSLRDSEIETDVYHRNVILDNFI